MSRKPIAGWFATLLVTTLVVPAVFFSAPQRASAQITSAISCLGSLFGGAASGAASAASGAASGAAAVLGVPVTSLGILAQTTIAAGATTGTCVDDTILKPLARSIARMILQQITASTINWINGNNGTGQPSFVTNISAHLQSVGDSVAFSFIGQVSTGFNSPFGSAISSALRANYLQQTSLAGFFAANRNTLPQFSQNPNAFLAGDWSQGGIAAWFALTTQDQNNPYTLYQTAQSQLAAMVGSAQAARSTELNWGQGFLSWCGVSDSAEQTQTSATAAYQAGFDAAGGAIATRGGINPGDACTNKDGTPGKIQTPGSIIHDYAQKAVVASGIDQLISAQDLDSALGAIVSALANQVLGGAGGFLGASTDSSGSQSLVSQLQNYSASNTAAASSATSIAQSKLGDVEAYTNAWNTIAAAANTASAAVTDLASFCTAAATSTASIAQIGAAQTALTVEITPILAQAQAALSSASTTRALVLKVQSEASTVTSEPSISTGEVGALSADVQSLVAAPPSTNDVLNAQQNARATGGARPSVPGGLMVSEGSLVDQMNLISANAPALKSVCR